MVDKWRVSSEEKVVNKILKYLMCIYKEKTKYFCIILLQYNYWNHICLFPSSELLLWQFLGEIQFYCTQEPSTLFSTSSVCWESHGWVFFFFYKHSNYCTLPLPYVLWLAGSLAEGEAQQSDCFAWNAPANSGLTLSESMIAVRGASVITVKTGHLATWSEITP